MGDRIFKFLEEVTDDMTLIIVFLFVVMVLNPDTNIVSTVTGGLLGYMAKKGGNINGQGK
jgi:hypothetical protein